eukprot:COSAG06_NODE_1936_length_8030_cov_4.318245_10_plen_219_part_00
MPARLGRLANRSQVTESDAGRPAAGGLARYVRTAAASSTHLAEFMNESTGRPEGMAAIDADTVATLLQDAATRTTTLEVLERHRAAVDRAVAVAAAPVVAELLAADATEVGRDEFDRLGLLLARLAADTIDDPSAVFGAAYGEGRYAAILRSKGSVLAQALRKPASEVTRVDARSFACSAAIMMPVLVKGLAKPLAAAGFANAPDYYLLYMTEEWFCK